MYILKAVKEWRYRTKLRLLDSMGKCCQVCSYSNSINAMVFHHIDGSNKDFSISSARTNPKAWYKLVEELRKCVLLCNRCHSEIHEGIISLPDHYAIFDESYLEYKSLYIEKSYCPICNKEKLPINKTCSYNCAAKLTRKINWDELDLYDLKYNQKLSFVKIGSIIGVSDVSVKKRMKKLGLLLE